MADNDASPPRPRGLDNGRRSAGERHSMAGHETGESSTSASLLGTTSVTTDSTTLAQSLSDEAHPAASPSPGLGIGIDAGNGGSSRREARLVHRSHKHRSSGAFLLSDALEDAAGHEHNNRSLRRRHLTAAAADGHRPKSTTHTPEKGHASPQLHTAAAHSPSPTPTPTPSRGQQDGRLPENGKADGADGVATKPSPSRSNVAFDMESAQIVNMALNLSESRRLASKRNVSQPLPPRLAPLPDSAVGGSLRQQLQQQRRSSRNMSPRPDRGGSRIVSGQRMSSPLQAAFDPLHDGSYRYHFSQSTLARAQKAKDHMELLTQYRRVLDLVPPLAPDLVGRASSASPPSSPSPAANSPHAAAPGMEPLQKLGRPYNPLQYIRNRKVRARERKAIDGEGQGFGEVLKVTDWVDDVAKWAATGQSRAPGSALLPPFSSSTDDLTQLQSSPNNSSRPTIPVTKPKRPRVDWAINPSDMLADIYWLEQEDNKRLVEDRHWRRVFPQDAGLYMPLSRKTDNTTTTTTTTSDSRPATGTMSDKEERAIIEAVTPEAQVAKTEHEGVLSSARERARQKLQDLKGMHHRHNSSIHNHDIFRIRKGELSDSSDTDPESRRRERAGTVTATGKDVLEKQMMDMIARENRDDEMKPAREAEAQRLKAAHASLMTPERDNSKPVVGSAGPRNRGHSRRGSRADLSESDEMSSFRGRSGPESPVKGRASLEVPRFGGRKMSVDYDSSRPTSPELRPTRDGAGIVPAIGADLSPSPSRAGSPVRNPLNKMRGIFRDHSRERRQRRDHGSEERAGGFTESLLSHADTAAVVVDAAPSPPDSKLTPERKSSRSPIRKIVSKGTGESQSHRSHRSIGSIRLRSDEGGGSSSSGGGSGLRNFFRNGPRIDAVLRTSVSKVSDMLWRKDSGETMAADSSGGLSSDESDGGEPRRGRSRGSAASSSAEASRRGHEETSRHGAKHFLDAVLPPLFPTSSHLLKRPAASDQPTTTLLSPQSAGSRPSSRSSRFDLLRPPTIDVQKASSSSSAAAAAAKTTPPRQADMSDDGGDSRRSSYAKLGNGGYQAAGERLNMVLSMPRPSFSAMNPRQLPPAALAAARRWSTTKHTDAATATTDGIPLSRREVARLRTMMLSTGILARELSSRAKEPKLLPGPRIRKTRRSLPPGGGTEATAAGESSSDSDGAGAGAGAGTGGSSSSSGSGGGGGSGNSSSSDDSASADRLLWADVARFAPDPTDVARRPVSQAELYPQAARILAASIQRSGQQWQGAADAFATRTAPALQRRADELRAKVAADLSSMTRNAADTADAVGADLVAGQRLKVKRVVDFIQKLLRRRRRRFRWVRRAGWLAVEWVLVGFMWYVWFVVMIARIFLGVGKGVFAGVRWLLWL